MKTTDQEIIETSPSTYRLLVPRLIVFMSLLVLTSSIWTHRYIPSTDGASHLYNNEIYSQPNNPIYHNYFTIRVGEITNFTTLYLSQYLLRWFDPFVVEKILLTIIFLTFALGLWYLLGVSMKNETRLWCFIFLIPVGMHFHFRMGFHNFSLGAALLLFLFATLWTYVKKPKWSHVLLTIIISLALSITHLFALALGLVAIWCVVPLTNFRRLRTWILVVPPSLFFALLYFGRIPENAQTLWDHPVHMILRFLRLDFIIGYTRADYLLSAVIWILLVISFWRLISTRGKASKQRNATQRRYGVLGTSGYLLLFAIMPQAMGGGSYVNGRLLLSAFLFSIPVFCFGVAWLLRQQWKNVALAGIILVQFVWVFSGLQAVRRYNHDLNAILAQTESLRNQVFFYHCTIPEGRFHRISAYLHLDSVVALEKDACSLSNYEAEAAYFHTSFSKDFPKPSWRREDGRLVVGNLDLLEGVDAVMLYTNDQVQIDSESWELISSTETPPLKLLIKKGL